MFTALCTLANAASSKNKLSPLSPMSNITKPGSPFSDMDISSSSDEKTPPSLLFKIDLEDEEEEDQLTGDPILPNISDLFNITPCPNQGLWDKNCTEAMDQLTNKAIMEFGKMTRTDPNSFALTMTHEPEKQMSKPYKDWMPSPHTWNNGVPHLPTPPSDTTTLDHEEAQTSIANSWLLPPSLPLKGTNVLGRILAHTEEFNGHPEAYTAFFQAVTPFCRHITYLGTNVAIDRYMSSAITLGPPTVSQPLPPYIHLTYADTLCNSKSICKPLTAVNKPPSISTGPHSTHGKHCHKCCVLGHIRHECPKHQGKKKVFFCK